MTSAETTAAVEREIRIAASPETVYEFFVDRDKMIQWMGRQAELAALIQAFFGAILAGVIPSIMPFLTEKLDPENYRDSLSALFQITQPAAVVTTQAYFDEVKRAQLDQEVSVGRFADVLGERFTAATLPRTSTPWSTSF